MGIVFVGGAVSERDGRAASLKDRGDVGSWGRAEKILQIDARVIQEYDGRVFADVSRFFLFQFPNEAHCPSLWPA